MKERKRNIRIQSIESHIRPVHIPGMETGPRPGKKPKSKTESKAREWNEAHQSLPGGHPEHRLARMKRSQRRVH